MAANKDKRYDAVVCTGRKKSNGLVSREYHLSASCGLADQAGLLDGRMQLGATPVVYGIQVGRE